MVPQEYQKFYLKDVTFVNLMMRRIYNVLIVANPYDAFMLGITHVDIADNIYDTAVGFFGQALIKKTKTSAPITPKTKPTP